MFIDLKINTKKIFKTKDYLIKKTKSGTLLKINKPIKIKEFIYETIPEIIDTSQPLIIETAKWSKILLHISQNGPNLLELIESEDEK